MSTKGDRIAIKTVAVDDGDTTLLWGRTIAGRPSQFDGALLVHRDGSATHECTTKHNVRLAVHVAGTRVILSASSPTSTEDAQTLFDSDVMNGEDNAGCDRCGTYDRVPGSRYCNGCITVLEQPAAARNDQRSVLLDAEQCAAIRLAAQVLDCQASESEQPQLMADASARLDEILEQAATSVTSCPNCGGPDGYPGQHAVGCPIGASERVPTNREAPPERARGTIQVSLEVYAQWAISYLTSEWPPAQRRALLAGDRAAHQALLDAAERATLDAPADVQRTVHTLKLYADPPEGEPDGGTPQPGNGPTTPGGRR